MKTLRTFVSRSRASTRAQPHLACWGGQARHRSRCRGAAATSQEPGCCKQVRSDYWIRSIARCRLSDILVGNFWEREHPSKRILYCRLQVQYTPLYICRRHHLSKSSCNYWSSFFIQSFAGLLCSNLNIWVFFHCVRSFSLISTFLFGSHCFTTLFCR